MNNALDQGISCSCRLNRSNLWYELNPEKEQCSNLSPIEKELIDLKPVGFRVVEGNVYFYYYYKSDFSAGEIIYKYLIYEHHPVDYTNREGDHSWKITCDEKISEKLRHIIMVEIN